MEVGRRELYAFAERHSGRKLHGPKDFVNGEVLCKLFSIVFPKYAVRPADPHTNSPSQARHRNWSQLERNAAALHIPQRLVDRHAIEHASGEAVVSSLVLLFFLYSLCKDGDCSIQFNVPLPDELADYVQSPLSVRALVDGGAMSPNAVPDHLRDSVFGDEADVPRFVTPQRDSPPRGRNTSRSEPAPSAPPVERSDLIEPQRPDAFAEELLAELDAMHEELTRHVKEKSALRHQLESTQHQADVEHAARQDLESAFAALKADFDVVSSARQMLEIELHKLSIASEPSPSPAPRVSSHQVCEEDFFPMQGKSTSRSPEYHDGSRLHDFHVIVAALRRRVLEFKRLSAAHAWVSASDDLFRDVCAACVELSMLHEALQKQADCACVPQVHEEQVLYRAMQEHLGVLSTEVSSASRQSQRFAENEKREFDRRLAQERERHRLDLEEIQAVHQAECAKLRAMFVGSNRSRNSDDTDGDALILEERQALVRRFVDERDATAARTYRLQSELTRAQGEQQRLTEALSAHQVFADEWIDRVRAIVECRH
jgi:hypothetical protein